MDTIRRCDYFSMDTAHKVGEGARLLGALRDEGVNLLAFTGFPSGRRARRRTSWPSGIGRRTSSGRRGRRSWSAPARRA